MSSFRLCHDETGYILATNLWLKFLYQQSNLNALKSTTTTPASVLELSFSFPRIWVVPSELVPTSANAEQHRCLSSPVAQCSTDPACWLCSSLALCGTVLKEETLITSFCPWPQGIVQELGNGQHLISKWVNTTLWSRWWVA